MWIQKALRKLVNKYILALNLVFIFLITTRIYFDNFTLLLKKAHHLFFSIFQKKKTKIYLQGFKAWNILFSFVLLFYFKSRHCVDSKCSCCFDVVKICSEIKLKNFQNQPFADFLQNKCRPATLLKEMPNSYFSVAPKIIG